MFHVAFSSVETGWRLLQLHDDAVMTFKLTFSTLTVLREFWRLVRS